MFTILQYRIFQSRNGLADLLSILTLAIDFTLLAMTVDFLRAVQ